MKNLLPVFVHAFNREVSAVVFVMDYLQIQFDAAVMTFHVFPRISVDGDKYEKNDKCYRNKLCELIGRRLIRSVGDDNVTELDFESGLTLTVIRSDIDNDMPELMSFDDCQTDIEVW
jgi:hypothetical protein